MGKSGYDKNQLEVEMIHHHQIITKQEQQAIYYLKLESKIQPSYSVPDEWATTKCDIVHIFYNKY